MRLLGFAEPFGVIEAGAMTQTFLQKCGNFVGIHRTSKRVRYPAGPARLIVNLRAVRGLAPSASFFVRPGVL